MSSMSSKEARKMNDEECKAEVVFSDKTNLLPIHCVKYSAPHPRLTSTNFGGSSTSLNLSASVSVMKPESDDDIIAELEMEYLAAKASEEKTVESVEKKKKVEVKKTFQSEEKKEEKKRCSLEAYKPTWAETFLVIGALFAPLSRGFSTGFTSPSVTKFVNDRILNVASGDVSLYGSLVSFGGMVGCLIAGPAMDKWGRKDVLFGCAIPQALGWLLIAIFGDYWLAVMTSRFLTGVGSAMVFSAYGTYIAETVDRRRRGMMCAVCELCISMGTTAAYFFGIYLNNRYLALVGAALTLLLMIGMFFQNETPRWLVGKGYLKEAFRVLALLRERESEADINGEINEIVARHNEVQKFNEKIRLECLEIQQKKKETEQENELQKKQEVKQNEKKEEIKPSPSSSSLSSQSSFSTVSLSSESEIEVAPKSRTDSFKSSAHSTTPLKRATSTKQCNIFVHTSILLKKLKRVQRQLIICLPMMFLQGLCGQTAVIAFMKSIFKLSNMEDRSAEYASVYVGCLRIVTTAIASVSVDRLGRRMLLMVGGVGQAVSLIAMGCAFYIAKMNSSASLAETGLNVTNFMNSSSLLNESSLAVAPIIVLNPVSTGLLFAGICCYLACYSFGWGTVPSIILSEMYPQTIRAVASSASTFIGLLAGSLTILFFHPLVSALGESGTFCLFAVDCIAGAFYAYFIVPETKSKSLESIEELISGRIDEPTDAPAKELAVKFCFIGDTERESVELFAYSDARKRSCYETLT
ncbi:hypothetical protein HELRODRAFT_190084 [Helobdella robusta]|uniref:Major facilitator superfamily (MFS) profile domain-containing protein n=1 Tax=Helobdella robusta TaxID=6412 RepID=T1FRN9_HELRO|nr:hypothetical protein HELRODRAFT_190084 [Helobdella robusta]ESO10548.1 hypothetical protein HELRODRAFT_190084 [Helobdella robusta]